MNRVINQMLRKYQRDSMEEEKGALREILQEILRHPEVLEGWSRELFSSVAKSIKIV